MFQTNLFYCCWVSIDRQGCRINISMITSLAVLAQAYLSTTYLLQARFQLLPQKRLIYGAS